MSGVVWFVARTADEVEALTPEWRALAATSRERSVFATPEWHRVWWTHFGDGRTFRVVGARYDGALIGLALLCTKTRFGIRIREWLGSEEADWGGLVLAPGAAWVAADLMRRAIEDDGWDLVDLWCVPSGSPALAAGRAALAATAVPHEVRTLEPNPVLDLRTDQWMEGVRREQLGRKRRGLGRQGDVRLVFPGDARAVDAALDDLRRLHVARWQHSGEVSRLTLAQYSGWVRGIAHEAFRQGWLYLPRLELNGELVATGLFLLYRRCLFQWINGHALAFARHSPFLLLQLAVIEHVRAGDTADVLDFGRGGEWYKFRWTRDVIPLQRVMGWRRLRGRGAHMWRGRVRPWAWEHQRWSRPVRRLKRLLQWRWHHVVGRVEDGTRAAAAPEACPGPDSHVPPVDDPARSASS